MKSEDLHLLINEEIYIIDKKEKVSSAEEKEYVIEHAPEIEVNHSQLDKTPSIPVIKSEEEISFVPVAFFHESSNENDLVLLQKIIEACKLHSDQYQVFANGFNKEVKFEKALVFVATAKKFYDPIPFEGGQILCSRPLNEIANNQSEKVKLWGALKGFI